jgi:thiopurine S-methyltransferase
MEAEFWIKAWNEGRTQFHQPDFNPKLTEHFARLEARVGQKVLVPLCGKTKDMIWLRRQRLEVHGVELHEPAVRDFFAENGLASPRVSRGDAHTHHAHDGITVSCGDFFKLEAAGTYDLVYDRAALVALPAAMRRPYARVVGDALKSGGRCLLITYTYDTSKMDGPPFSVEDSEVRALYQDRFSVELLESRRPEGEGARLSAVQGLKQNVYLLSKTG